MKTSEITAGKRFLPSENGNKEVTQNTTELLPVQYIPEKLKGVDPRCIAKKYYNSFNFSKLAGTLNSTKMTIGVTSAGRGDGKTLVAANMAVSLASGYNLKTVLVDMNFYRPDLHRVFHTVLSPGLSEAIELEQIRVETTAIKNLSLITAGSSSTLTPGIEHTLILRKILQALKHTFDFVIIDMGPVIPVSRFPIHFINEIDGLIGVIDSKNTKKDTFNSIFKHIDEHQFIGYVFNKVTSA